MDSFKHCVFLADVCAARCAYAALEFSSFVSDNIAVKVRKNEHLEICSSFLIDKLCCSDINIPFVGCDFGIILANFFAEVEELTVCGLDNVSLLDDGNSVFAVSSFNDDITELMRKRKELIGSGKLEEAKEIEQKLVAINPEYFMYLNL